MNGIILVGLCRLMQIIWLINHCTFLPTWYYCFMLTNESSWTYTSVLSVLFVQSFYKDNLFLALKKQGNLVPTNYLDTNDLYFPGRIELGFISKLGL